MTSQKAVLRLIVLTSVSIASAPARAGTPYGYLDAAGEGVFAGWARDDDFSGPVQVEIYVDGNYFMTGPADGFRADVGAHAFHFIPNTFGPGLHTVNAYALGVNGAGQPDGDRIELGNSPKTWTGAPPPPVMQADGQPFFMMGWYDSNGSSSVAESEQYLSILRRQGMNTTLICYGIWLDNNSMTNRMEGAIASDMKIMVEVNRWAVQELEGYPLSVIDDQVDLLKNYSSMLAWYLIDEPEFQNVTPAMTQARYDQIKTRDPNHDITVAHAGYMANYVDPYLAAEPPPYCDVLMTDTYPVTDPAPEFAAPLWMVAVESRIRTIQTGLHGKNAHINIVQTHGGDFGVRIPTYIENRYLSYAPIVQGARGLLYWMRNAYTTAGHRDQVVPPVAHEIQSLVPAIISNSTAVFVSSNRDTDTTGHFIRDITYLFGEDERCGYLIATNNTPNTHAVQFQLIGNVLAGTLGADPSVPVMFEQRSVTAQPTGDPDIWTLADSVGPYGVHVYRLYEIAAPPAAAALPGKASKPQPDHASTSVGRTFDLHWTPGADATSYQVFFGTTDPPSLQGQQTSTIFDPGQLSFNTTYYWRIDSINDQGTTTGDLWSFTTLSLNLPEKASNPNPAMNATNIELIAGLMWKWGGSARSYNVYFGTTNPPPFQTNTAGFAFTPSMTYCTTYYWRIDPVNDDGITVGDVWSFTTQPPPIGPAQPSNPTPPHQAVNVRVNADLSWAGANTTQYSIYLGTIDPPTFQVAQANTTYDPGALLPRTTYYWRVDASKLCVTTTGELWTFATGSLNGDLDADDDSDQTDFGIFQRCFSGSGIAYPVGCADADLNGDADVDQNDFTAFLQCMAGSNHLPGC